MKFKFIFFFLSVSFLLLYCTRGNNNKMNSSPVEKEKFGTVDGKEIDIYTLTNQSGAQVRIINYGAIVVSLLMPDRDGNFADIVTGYDSLKGYINDNSFFGAIVGRYGNRIDKGKFQLDGKNYQLTINSGENHLHGGFKGFYKAVWDVEPLENIPGNSLKLTYLSPDGDEGYPGTVKIAVTYTLTDNNELKIEYEGTTDKPTILNPTHHSYFNLTGDFSNTILNHELYIDADYFTPVNQNIIPTGEFAAVKNTPMDFRQPTPIGLHINDKYEQLKFGLGYDHNWALNEYRKGMVRKIASLYDPKTGRFMEILTDQPGLQFYSGNFLNGTSIGKGGVAYQYRTALCLETQDFPDAPNKSNFPSAVLRPGETYKQTTIYEFSVK
jgi:aldose 1-epimerase